jgi:hypothetical protein
MLAGILPLDKGNRRSCHSLAKQRADSDRISSFAKVLVFPSNINRVVLSTFLDFLPYS